MVVCCTCTFDVIITPSPFSRQRRTERGEKREKRGKGGEGRGKREEGRGKRGRVVQGVEDQSWTKKWLNVKLKAAKHTEEKQDRDGGTTSSDLGLGMIRY